MVTICINNCREIAEIKHFSSHQNLSEIERENYVIGNYSYTNRYK